MAFMSQDRKKAIHAELKKIIPPSWKYSLAVRHHSTLVLNIWASPVDFMGALHMAAKQHWHLQPEDQKPKQETYSQLNPYHWVQHFGADSYALKYNTDPTLAPKPVDEINWGPLGEANIRLFGRIMDALNGKGSGKENHDKSDIQSDYFDVGWYVDVNLGKWNKPYQLLEKSETAMAYVPIGSDGSTLVAEGVKIIAKNPAPWSAVSAVTLPKKDFSMVFGKLYNTVPNGDVGVAFAELKEQVATAEVPKDEIMIYGFGLKA